MSLLEEIKNKKHRSLVRAPIFLKKSFNEYRNRSRTHKAVISLLSDIYNPQEVENYYLELKQDKEFVSSITKETNIIGVKAIPKQAVISYIITRVEKPKKVVETGVNTGWSSACILKAIERNSQGKLYSIDFPGTEDDPVKDENHPESEVEYKLADKNDVGFRVPEELKSEWDLTLGKSQEKLKPLLERIGEIDVFLHDSLHSYELMKFEFEAVYPHLNRGILISDDVNWNDAFNEFSKNNKSYKLSSYYTRSMPDESDLGIILKN